MEVARGGAFVGVAASPWLNYVAAMHLAALDVERDGPVLTVALDRPAKKNAANAAMWVELAETFRSAASDAEVRVVVVTGRGGEFCSGADLSDLGRGDEHALSSMRRVHEAALSLHRLPQPTIAKVDGVAVGAGCNLALGCDLVVASERARFSQIFARRGLSPDFGGSWILPRVIGLHRAKELAFFAEILSAAEAFEAGLVNRVVPSDELDAFVAAWAGRLAAGPPLALAMAKSMLNDSASMSFAEALSREAEAQALNITSADGREALSAFVERREPRFEGR